MLMTLSNTFASSMDPTFPIFRTPKFCILPVPKSVKLRDGNLGKHFNWFPGTEM